MTQLATPFYFGPDRGLFGLIHVPDGPIRTAVVICPAVAYEEVCAHRSLRLLAEQLADGGALVIRFDYPGTGNSPGSTSAPGVVDGWEDAVCAAVDEARRWNPRAVLLVGLRFGATLAARVVDPAGADGIVLWDPIVSGRRYLRALRLLGEKSPGGGIVVAGVPFGDEALATIGRINLPPAAALVPELVIARSEDTSSTEPLPFDAASGPLEIARLPGISAMLETDAELAVVPTTIIDATVAWIEARWGPTTTSPTSPTSTSPTSDNPTPVLDGHTIDASELAPLGVTARRIGAGQLLAVITQAADLPLPTCAVVAINNGAATSIGPGGAWVRFAHGWAAQGWATWRVDLAGLGDSPARSGRADNDTYPPTAARDVADIVAELRSAGITHIAFIGLCSGALLALDGAVHTRSVDAVIGINGRFDKPFTDRRRDRRDRAAGQTWRPLALPLSKRPLAPLFDRVPGFVWATLDRLRMVASPVGALERAVDAGTRVTLVFGPDELGLRALRRRAGNRFRRVQHDAAVNILHVPGLDHSMFSSEARRDVEHLVRAELAATFPTRSFGGPEDNASLNRSQ